jgi:hypothetical protein
MNVVYISHEKESIACPACLNEITPEQRAKAEPIKVDHPLLYKSKLICPHCQAELELRGFNIQV